MTRKKNSLCMRERERLVRGGGRWSKITSGKVKNLERLLDLEYDKSCSPLRI